MNRQTNQLNQLKTIVKGDVYTDRIYRYLLSTDGSIFCIEPICVVYPKDTTDVQKVVKFANENGITVHPRGAGSGVCGAALGSGICLDFTRYMNSRVQLDLERQTIECQPGYRLGELEALLKGTGLFFPPDPSSGEFATFGGMYNTNASGAHSVKYGNVADYIEDAEIVLGNGDIVRLSEIRQTPYPQLPLFFQQLFDLYQNNYEPIETSYPNVACNVCGYHLKGLVNENRLDLRKLFAGSEGTLGIATCLTFRLIPKPPHDSLVIAFFDSIVSSVQAVQKILPMNPSGIEIMDKSLLYLAREMDDRLKYAIPIGIDNVLMIEFDSIDCDQQAIEAQHIIKANGFSKQVYTAISNLEKERFWAIRKAAVPILYRMKGSKKAVALIEDAAVPTDALEAFFKGLYDIFETHRVRFVIYGHIAKGLLHTRPLLNLKSPDDIKMLQQLAGDVFGLVKSLHGTISGEHGDGRLRSGFIREMYPNLYNLFIQTKKILDPKAILNPDIKTSDQHIQTNQLRFGKSYHQKNFPNKQLIWLDRFEDEVETCHGCSKCTTVTLGSRMCPVYKVTRDEIASPKAKANILRGIINGAIPDRMIVEDQFKSVMDTCIQCGSCYAECPSAVNIPKLVIEARSQYINQVGMPFHDQWMSSPNTVLKIISILPHGLKNILHASSVHKIVKDLIGISPNSDKIRFPARNLYNFLGRDDNFHSKKLKDQTAVLYFPGCYATYINPNVGLSAITVLKKIGFMVMIPPHDCCGLPALSKGNINQARIHIEKNLFHWGHFLDAIDHVVVTCPSCGLSILQKWQMILSNRSIDIIGKKLIHISTLINRRFDRLFLQPLDQLYAYHLPCHLKILPHASNSIELLKKATLGKIVSLPSACCGMAGTWGMLEKNFMLSKKIGDPMFDAIKNFNGNGVVTDCPTCALQIQRFGHPHVQHPVELIANQLSG